MCEVYFSCPCRKTRTTCLRGPNIRPRHERSVTPVNPPLEPGRSTASEHGAPARDDSMTPPSIFHHPWRHWWVFRSREYVQDEMEDNKSPKGEFWLLELYFYIHKNCFIDYIFVRIVTTFVFWRFTPPEQWDCASQGQPLQHFCI
jgi:hypothetical protein